MNLRYLSIAAILSIGTLSAQNLIKNGDFDKPLNGECRFDAAPGVSKSEVFTEHLTWNKCLKMEVVKYVEEKNGKKYYALARFGGDQKMNGFPVKPNTVYRYAIELKGDVAANVSAAEWTGSDYWKNVKSIKITGTTAFKPSKDWTVLRGTFQTSANATHAAIGVSIWGEERYKNLPAIGGFILIDKIKVEEKSDLFGAFQKKSDVKADSIPERKIAAPGRMNGNFSDYKTGEKAKTETLFTAQATDTGIRLNIRCKEPAMNQLKSEVRENGKDVWKDDVVEIFFDPVTKERALTQLVVSAGGGRWMGFGTTENINRYHDWNAKVTKEKDAWVIDAEIPYTLLGWEKRPAPGTAIGFNIARDRKGSPRELTSFSFAKGSFHDRTKFAILLLDSPDLWFEHLKKTLTAESQGLGNPNLSSKIKSWINSGVPEKIDREAEAFRKEITAAKLGSSTFVLTEIDPTMDPTIPMLPSNITEAATKISLRAAGNEYKALPLAITNLLNRPEEYRIQIVTFKENGLEENGLKSAQNALFPAEKIKLLRGVRMKDGDEKNHGLRFDALAPMDATSTVVVMPKEATPVWAVFHTAGIKPGIYKGVIRVIPLGERAEIDPKTLKYKGAMKDLPFTFEVLPFELDKAPALPQFLFGDAYNRDSFRMLMEYGTDSILVNTWGFRVKFNKDGSIQKRDTEEMEHKIRNLKKWAEEYGLENDLKIGVAYSAYILFRDTHSGKQFKVGSPEWERGWKEYVKVLEDVRKKCGIKNENYFVEIWDEPNAKEIDELILASKIAHETVPSMNMMITFGAWEVPKLEQLVPYISHWCLWSTKMLAGKEHAPLIKQLRDVKKNISIYTCEVTMRLDLQKYFRAHPWTALAYDMDMSNMFQFMTYRYVTHDWKLATYGNIARMASGVPVSTIRLECLRVGNNDIKYMKKLADTLKTSKTQDSKLKAEVQEFLKSTPKKVGITMAHDSSAAAQAREKAIDLTLKLMKQ